MPSTLTGLLLFVVLLLPGFAYLVGKERAGTERRTSPFRETVAVISASVYSELAVVTLTWYWWSQAIDVDLLITDLGGYWRERPGLLAAWGLGLLLVATIVANLATRPWLRRLIPGRYPHPSTVSAWWVLFETWRRRRYVHAGCVLDDGSYVAGTVESFNMSADDDTARDLILTEPLEYRQPNAKATVPLDGRAVCVPANRIVMIKVNYVSRRLSSGELAAAREAAEGGEAGDPLVESRFPSSDRAPRSVADSPEPTGPEPDAGQTCGQGHSDRPSSLEQAGPAASPISAPNYPQANQPPSQVLHAPGPSRRPLGPVQPVDPSPRL